MTQKDNETKKTSKSPPHSFHLEACRIRGGMSIVVGGIIGISDFGDGEVTLKTHSGRVSVTGKGLSVTVYEGGSVEIVGFAKEIKFAYGKN